MLCKKNTLGPVMGFRVFFVRGNPESDLKETKLIIKFYRVCRDYLAKWVDKNK